MSSCYPSCASAFIILFISAGDRQKSVFIRSVENPAYDRRLNLVGRRKKKKTFHTAQMWCQSLRLLKKKSHKLMHFKNIHVSISTFYSFNFATKYIYFLSVCLCACLCACGCNTTDYATGGAGFNPVRHHPAAVPGEPSSQSRPGTPTTDWTDYKMAYGSISPTWNINRTLRAFSEQCTSYHHMQHIPR